MNIFSVEVDAPSGPASRAMSVTPSDTDSFNNSTRALYVGTTGDVKVSMLSENIVTFKNAVGWLPIQVSRVWATGTTATSIVALW